MKSKLSFQNRVGAEGARPFAFTEQGVAMLSSVLRSERAVKVNIAIMRAFVKLRETLETNRELAQRFSELEKRVGKHDDEIAPSSKRSGSYGAGEEVHARDWFSCPRDAAALRDAQTPMIAWTIYLSFAGAILLLFLPRVLARWLALATTASRVCA